ncbi:hypothetical protein [Nocardia sp. A7]|uniref:hypothetical protein n=1 Tax=Nocardia sp. A7 TaxID=2789274 RepID=UPI00397D9B26
MNDEKLLVKALAFMACTVTTGWFIAFIILPAVRPPEYQPAPEITMLMGTVFTGLAGSLAAAYYKARNPKDDSTDKESGDRDAD